MAKNDKKVTKIMLIDISNLTEEDINDWYCNVTDNGFICEIVKL